ncbi:TetR family transcriptional regulator [Virgisporangium aliadipatigenens]|uniref:TetR family transcriptional regulator n=1 Tax=Virgisporangium aliadipatigenens TaxID=741659 RepID=A0A8J4DNG5_9ACTN|nr:TetR/AcrR family transcriptional regulator [Virgisporangium aliadipatigenens]GIJ43497.1 TetR family transcriptional regulator [Virgisporangium aliadipatigenens]
MISRVESAAATRRALVDAAAELLDEGGPSAVTLREVGARAGVSRGAPYKHFADKESLLSAVAIEAWERNIAGQRALRADAALAPVDRLRAALTALIAVGRQQPHLFQQMFTIPSGDPAAVARVAQRSQDEFLAMVAAVVGERDARRYGALLLAGAHGVTAMEVSGHLSTDKWRVTAEELVTHLVELVATTAPAAEPAT